MPVRFAAACAAMLLMLPLSSADFDIGSLPELDPELTCGGCLEQSKTYCCGNFTIPPAQKQNRENVMNSQSGRTYAPGENVRCSCITKTGRMSAGRICLVKNFDTSLGTFPWYGRTVTKCNSDCSQSEIDFNTNCALCTACSTMNAPQKYTTAFVWTQPKGRWLSSRGPDEQERAWSGLYGYQNYSLDPALTFGPGWPAGRPGDPGIIRSRSRSTSRSRSRSHGIQGLADIAIPIHPVGVRKCWDEPALLSAGRLPGVPALLSTWDDYRPQVTKANSGTACTAESCIRANSGTACPNAKSVYATGTGFDAFGNIAVINIIQVLFALTLLGYYAGAMFHRRAILQAFRDHGEDADATLVSQRKAPGTQKYFVYFSTVQFDAVAASNRRGDVLYTNSILGGIDIGGARYTSSWVTKEFSTGHQGTSPWNEMHPPGTTVAVKYMPDDPRMCIVAEFLNNPNAQHGEVGTNEIECNRCCMIFFPLPIITPAFWCYGFIVMSFLLTPTWGSVYGYGIVVGGLLGLASGFYCFGQGKGMAAKQATKDAVVGGPRREIETVVVHDTAADGHAYPRYLQADTQMAVLQTTMDQPVTTAMPCPSCGAALADGSKFCNECGVAQPHDKPCVGCGANLAEADPIKVGSTVTIEGLQGAAEYNGCTGTVSEFDEESSRFVVALDKKPKPNTTRNLRVKRANLKLGGSKFCQMCGAQQEKEDVKAAPPWCCSACGSENAADADACRECQLPMYQEPETSI